MAETRRQAIPGWLVVLGVIIVLGVIVRLITISSNSPADAPAESNAAALPSLPHLDVSWPAEQKLSPPWRLAVGMNQMDVRALMGKPDVVKHDDEKSGVDSEWDYPEANPPTYVYFETSYADMSKFGNVSRIQRAGPPPPAARRPTDAQVLSREARKDYAAKIDGKMLDAGIESTTRTSGPGDTTLLITDVLAGRVRAKVIANAMDFELLKNLGFRKLVYTNGFEDELRTTFRWNVE